mgnify:FL=1
MVFSNEGFNNEDGFPYPTPAEVDDIEGLELSDFTVEETDEEKEAESN